MEWLLGMVLTPIGRIVAGVLALVASFGAWLALHDHSIRKDEHATTIATVNEGAKSLNAKGLKARSAAAGPGAAEWLKKHSCRDCR